MNKSYFVIDNNILVSRLLIPKSIPAQAVKLAFEKGTVLVSDETLQELVTVLDRRKFDKYLSLEERRIFIHKLKIITKKIDITDKINICRDPKDDKFLELAVNGKAKLIVTGDEDLLILNIFRGIEILTPKDFIAKLSD